MHIFGVEPGLFGAAFAAGGIVGVVSPELKTAVVRPSHRRRGVGRRLIDLALSMEASRHRPELFMGSVPDDPGGAAFLEATGFTFHSTVWNLDLPPDRAVPDAVWPDGVIARRFDRDLDVAALPAAVNEAFVGHPTPIVMEEEMVRASLDDPDILDEDTMGSMIKFWQSERLGRSDVPSADKLLTAPIVEFYDPTRSPDLLQLERDTYTAYKRMLQAAAKDLKGSVRFTKDGELAEGEKFFRIVSAFRSPEYQAKLRAASPGSGRAALAMRSAHSTGQALDIYVGGEPVSTKDANRLIQVNTPAYKWLVKNAHRFGFYNYFYEPWHWEYVPANIGR